MRPRWRGWKRNKNRINSNMGLVENITAYLKGKVAGKEIAAPEGICPNCWGSQEYAGAVRELEEDFQVDVNAGNAQHAFIQKFMVKYVDGIKLRNKIDGLTCERCKMVYPHEKADH